MNNEKLQLYLQKYKKQWERFKDLPDGIKLFYEWAKAKEKQKKIQEKLKAKTERERKREARALIILAKLMIKENPQLVEQLINKHYDEFKQKERGKEVDYAYYISKLLYEK